MGDCSMCDSLVECFRMGDTLFCWIAEACVEILIFGDGIAVG